MPDELVLRDSLGEAAPTSPTTVPAHTTRVSATHWRLDADFPAGPSLVVLGQNFDPRWSARIDGTRAGPVVPADGYSAAFVVSGPGRHVVDVTYSAQHAADRALVVSLVTGLLCVILLLEGPPRTVPLVAPRPRPGGTSSRRRLRRGGLAGWVLIGLGAWVFLGWPLLALTVVLGVVHRVRPWRPSTLVVAGAVALACCPVAFVLGNLDEWGRITPQLVLADEWPHWLGAAALLLLAVAVWLDDPDPVEPEAPGHGGHTADPTPTVAARA
jgi:hypothetical protein